MNTAQRNQALLLYETLYATIEETFDIIELQHLYDILQKDYINIQRLKFQTKKERALDKMLCVIHSILINQGIFKSTPLLDNIHKERRTKYDTE